MLTSAYTLGRVWGIPIRLHFSLLIALFWAMASQNFLGALLFIVCLLASVTAHELGHCFVALRLGCRVKDIKLTLIGGIASIYDPPRRPRDEILLAAAGPVVSLSLALLLALLSWLLHFGFRIIHGQHLLHGVGFIQILPILAAINLVLGVFNLIPAIPMDGGRILRAALTPKKGYVEATFVTMRTGQIIAILLGIWGLFGGGFTLVLISIFVYFSAAKEYAMARLQSMTGMGDAWFAGTEPLGDNEVEVSASPWAKSKRKKRIRIRRD